MGIEENLKKLRKQHGWSQTQLAEKTGCHVTHINRIETGKYKPSLNVLQKFVGVFSEAVPGHAR